MDDARKLQEFLRPLEEDLTGAVRRIAERALNALDQAQHGAAGGDASDRLGAREMLEGREISRFVVGWMRSLRATLRDGDEHHHETVNDPPNTLASALTLKDKEEIDEDIELARLTQDLESDCEATLRELRVLYSGLRGLDSVDLQAPPLTPQRCARTLIHTVRALPLSPGGRLLLLRAVVPPALDQLPPLFAADVRRLKAAGVEPAAYRVMPGHDFGATGHGGLPSEGPEASDVGMRIQSVLNRLMSHADHPGIGQAPPVAISDAWMEGVLRAVQQEARPSPSMRRLMDRLAEPGQLLARAEPDMWRQADHAWWALLDRLLALCAVLDGQPGGAQDRFAERCDQIVAQLLPEDGMALDSAMCRTLLEELTTAAQALASAPAPMHESAEAGGPSSGLLKLVREQMSQQLRISDAPGSVRRFLMGPWLRVLTSALDPERGNPGEAQRYTEWVDRLLGSMRSNPRNTDLAALLDNGRKGLTSIGVPEGQIATWMEDLQQRLEERRQQPEETPAQPAWRHEDLPTVPIDLHPSAHGARARRDRIAWINGLRVGDVCRLFIEDRWYTAQLVVDPVAEGKDDQVFVFQSRDPFERLALSKDTLVLLRADGLATTVEPGAFIAKALGTMPADLDPRPGRRRPR